MKALVRVISIVTIMLVTWVANAADSADRPAGIVARNWIAITERLGFVVVDDKKVFPPLVTGALLVPPDSVSAEHRPPRKGYFVVKTEAGWERLTVVAPSDSTG